MSNKTNKEHMKSKDLLHEALTEGSTDSQLGYLLANATHNTFMDIVKILLKSYDDKHNLLNEFFQSKSDASSLEATEQEKLESDFNGWVLASRY